MRATKLGPDPLEYKSPLRKEAGIERKMQAKVPHIIMPWMQVEYRAVTGGPSPKRPAPKKVTNQIPMNLTPFISPSSVAQNGLIISRIMLGLNFRLALWVLNGVLQQLPPPQVLLCALFGYVFLVRFVINSNHYLC